MKPESGLLLTFALFSLHWLTIHWLTMSLSRYLNLLNGVAILILGGLLIVYAFSPRATQSTRSGRLVGVPEHVYLGDHRQKEQIPFEFQIKNDTGDVVHITKISSTCGCTTLHFDKQSLQNNEDAPLSGIMDTGRSRGGVVATIFIHYKTAGDPEKERYLNLYCSVNTVPHYVNAPSSLMWTNPGDQIKIRFETQYDPPLSISGISINDPGFTIERCGGVEHEFSITFDTDRWSGIRKPLNLELKTDSPFEPDRTIPVRLAFLEKND